MISLKTLPTATAQQVFDQVAAHLLAQKRKSMFGDSCGYRGDDGLKCAAGCLIADDEYDIKVMECRKWSLLVEKGVVPGAHDALIGALQDVHDLGPDPATWRKRLAEVAHRFGLSFTSRVDS